MIIISIRTDKPEAEIGLFDNAKQLAYESWPAHRELAETIHKKIELMLKSKAMSWSDIQGIVCFKGPGSFTGLRIGLTVGNAISFGLHVPIVAEKGDNWLQTGSERLQNKQSDPMAMPYYGSPVYTTKPAS
jgi:tRNA threonylcarbamoyladenosine biosynthesis protein TsaB